MPKQRQHALVMPARIRATVWALALLVLVASTGQAVAEDLHAVTMAAHAAARDSIRTCTCRVETNDESTSLSTGPIKRTGDYLRSGEAVRVKVKQPEGTRDIVYRDATLRAFNKLADSGGVIRPGGALQRAGIYPSIDCDPWSRGLLVVPDPHSVLWMPYEKLVSLASGRPKAERRQDGGRTYVAVDLKFDKKAKPLDWAWDITVWFDPTVNHLIRRVTMTMTSPQRVVRDYRVLQFREAAPAVFFPERTEFTSQTDGKLTAAGSTTVLDLAVNQTVAADALDLKFPRGVAVVDSIRGVTYVSDGGDGSLGPPQPMGKAVPPPPANANNHVRTEPGQSSAAESPARSWYLVFASLAVLALAGLVTLFRSRRAKPVAQ